jgi:hypothetical protein
MDHTEDTGRLLEEETSKRDEVQPSQGIGQPLVILDQPRNRDAQAKSRSTTHRLGKSTKPRFASSCLTTSNLMA